MERQDAAQIIGRNVRHRPEKSFILPNLAVKGKWNGDGAFVEYEVPKGGMKVWSGEAAPQMSSDGVNMLSGGGNQIWVSPGSTNASTPISTGFIK